MRFIIEKKLKADLREKLSKVSHIVQKDQWSLENNKFEIQNRFFMFLVPRHRNNGTHARWNFTPCFVVERVLVNG